MGCSQSKATAGAVCTTSAKDGRKFFYLHKCSTLCAKFLFHAITDIMDMYLQQPPILHVSICLSSTIKILLCTP